MFYSGKQLDSLANNGVLEVEFKISWGEGGYNFTSFAELLSLDIYEIYQNSSVSIAKRVNIGYKYGFQGQLRDDAVSGSGNSYTAEFWQYDSRLGRRWNRDPVTKYHESPYSAFANNPIWFIDPNGADTTFANNKDKQFVNQFLDKNNANFDRKYKRKVRRLIKSDKKYHFQSIQPGQPSLEAGRTLEDPNDPNQIYIFFTTGNSNMNKDPSKGISPYKALWEETYHAWDVDRGKLDLYNPTGMDETRAWKFAAKAPGSKISYTYKYLGMSYTGITVNYRIKNASKLQIARWLVNGMKPKFDQSNGMRYAGMYDFDKNGKFIGLYHGLPIKK